MAAVSEVAALLQPWLGPRLTAALMPEAEEIARTLSAYTIRQDPDALYQALDSVLFRAIHTATRGSMLVEAIDGGFVRMRLEDVSTLADELLYLALKELPIDQKHLQAVQQYALRRDSLAALKALYLHFAPLQTQQELQAISSLIRNCYPPFRYRMWLEQADDGI